MEVQASGKKPLVIVGAGEFAQIAYEYFTHDSDYEVVAFAVEQGYEPGDTLYGRPVLTLEEMLRIHPPGTVAVYVAITYTQLNRLRRRLYRSLKELGYPFATYVSSRAFVWRNVQIGENCFIFEHNVLQPFVEIGDNVVLWSGNHVGHRSVIRDHVYVSSHAVISGYCEIGECSFIGVNSTFADRVLVADSNFIAAGAVVTASTEPDKVYQGNPAQAARVPATRFCRVKSIDTATPGKAGGGDAMDVQAGSPGKVCR